MAQEEAERRDAQVDAVHLELGALAGVVKEALLFSYGMACDGTCSKDHVWSSRTFPSKFFARAAASPTTLQSMQWFYCPDCGAATAEILHGKELVITALELKQ